MKVSVKVYYVRDAVALVSGGKDSVYALFLSILQGFHVVECITLFPPKEAMLFHHPNARHAGVICRALGIPHRALSIRGDEEEALADALSGADAEWVIVGAIASEYQRMRFNAVAEELGLLVHAPLWHVPPEKILRMLVRDGFRFVIVFAGAEGMEEWLGKEVGAENVEIFIQKAHELRINPAGEGGEYESFVVSLPNVRFRYSGRKEGLYFLLTKIKI